MRLTSHKLHEIDPVTEDDLVRAFEPGAIGKYVHLWRSEGHFIQAGCRGTPSKCAPPDDPLVRELVAFIDRTGESPWTLEVIEGTDEYRAREDLTLAEVHRAFRSYLEGDDSWRGRYEWVRIA